MLKTWHFSPSGLLVKSLPSRSPAILRLELQFFSFCICMCHACLDLVCVFNFECCMLRTDVIWCFLLVLLIARLFICCKLVFIFVRGESIELSSSIRDSPILLWICIIRPVTICYHDLRIIVVYWPPLFCIYWNETSVKKFERILVNLY